MKRPVLAVLVLILSLFVVSCQVPHIDTKQLIGKSRQEALEIVFVQTRRNDQGEVTICIPGYAKGPWGISLHYKNIESALNDKRLMEADSWEIDHSKGTIQVGRMQTVSVRPFAWESNVLPRKE